MAKNALRSLGYALAYPNRLVVIVDSEHQPPKHPVEKPFVIYRGLERIGSYRTHRRAIEAAQRIGHVRLVAALQERAS